MVEASYINSSNNNNNNIMSQDRFSDTQQQSSGYNQGLNPNAAAMLRASQGQGSGMMGSNPMSAMLPNNMGGGGGGADQQQASLNISNEIKRLQQLHQLGNSQTPGNGLLMTGSQNRNDNSAAFLQSMFDQQQKAQNPRLDEAFRQNMGNQNPMLQPGFLQDARFLMAQNQLQPGMQSQLPMQGGQGQSQQQQQLLQQNQQQGQGQSELPLPSPHSLFHRDGSRRMRGGVIEPFPEKLHRLLMEVEAAGLADVISFVANGRAFAIHKPDKFFKEIVPLYFRQSRLSSFKRQLNLYGFELINTGPARGGYYHELFVKDRAELCRRMRRVAVKVVSQQPTKDEDKGSREGKGEDQVANDAGDNSPFESKDEHGVDKEGIGAPDFSD
jgi:hypothetical protein